MVVAGTTPWDVLVPGTHSVLGENLVLCHDRASGLTAAISVDDTTLGPGLGGVRWLAYPSFEVATEEACRLSRVMTLKNALADIPFGGAKSVILRQEADGAVADTRRRTAQLLAFGGFINRLGGAYVPGVDMGTSVADLATIATVTPWASCAQNDPSPATAEGVFFAIEAAVRHSLARPLAGVRRDRPGRRSRRSRTGRAARRRGGRGRHRRCRLPAGGGGGLAGWRHCGQAGSGPCPSLRRVRSLCLGPDPEPDVDRRTALRRGGRCGQRCAGRPGGRHIAGRAGHHLRA